MEMIEIRVDVDEEKHKAASEQERQAFILLWFDVGSQLTADYGATIDFSDPFHWVIKVPAQYEQTARKLLNA